MPAKLVTVTSFWYAHEAELARLHLAEAGVQSFIFEDFSNSLGYFGANATGGIKLQVAECDVERALAVIATWPAPRTRSEVASSDLEPLRCLACGKRMLEDQIECQECGWSYLADSEETETDNLGRADQDNNSEEATD